MRRRLLWTFAVFALGLSTLFGTLLVTVYHHLEDWLCRKQLTQAMQNADGGSAFGALVQVASEDEHGSVLRERIAGLGDGHHELLDSPLSPIVNEEVHVLIRTDPEGRRQVAVMRIPGSEMVEQWAAIAVWMGVLALTLTGLIVGIVLARRSVRPIESLTDWLRRGDSSEPPPRDLPDPETRLLASALESYLVQMNSQLERERAFLREASHELRNPISVIKGVSELAEEQSLPPEGLQRIQRSVQRMEHAVEGLLALARKEQGIQGASFEQEWSAMLDEYREGFDGELLSSEEWLPVEPLAARMIVILAGTLLRNAIEHAQASQVTLTLTTEAFEIHDDGIGIDDLQAVPEALERGHPLPRGGLGLALVARICRRMGWTLSLENTPGLRVQVGFQEPEGVAGSVPAQASATDREPCST
ncbi:MAG: HAMP domain-containing sensor histidine kinase [Acidobacteriota bacterium]